MLGNKANISGMRDQFKEESLTGFHGYEVMTASNGEEGLKIWKEQHLDKIGRAHV